jgi:hypothetical protein
MGGVADPRRHQRRLTHERKHQSGEQTSAPGISRTIYLVASKVAIRGTYPPHLTSARIPSGGSVPRTRPITRSDVDPVDLVPVSERLAIDRAVVASYRDPSDGKCVFFGTAAEDNRDRITDLDPRGQRDMVVMVARGRDKPITAFGENPGPARRDGVDKIGLTSGGWCEIGRSEQKASNPDSQRHQPSPNECPMIHLPSPSRPLNQPRKPR